MANKFVYVVVIHQTRVTFPCGIVSDLSEDNKNVKYILDSSLSTTIQNVGVTHSKQNKFWY